MAPSVFKIADLVAKLDTLSNTQESIQKTSLWIIHHKAHASDIVQQWTKSYCSASPKRQLTLFYLANDVIQNSKKKSLPGYTDGFKEALQKACKETDDSDIFTLLNRVLQIWKERCIYEKEFIDELRELLYGDDLRMQLTNKIIKEFQPHELYQLSSEVDKLAQQIKVKQQLFNNCKIDIANPVLNQLKDKSYGKHYQEDFDAATRAFKNLVEAKKVHAEKLAVFVEQLDKAKIYYSSKCKEVINLSDRYQAYEDGCINVRDYILNRKSNSVTNFSPSKLNSLLVSVTGSSSSRSLENRISNIFSGHNDLPSFDYFNSDNGYNPYQVTPNTSIDLENHQATDMDIESSEDEASNPANSAKKSKIEVPYGLPPPPKQPKFQDFYPKTSTAHYPVEAPPPPPPSIPDVRNSFPIQAHITSHHEPPPQHSQQQHHQMHQPPPPPQQNIHQPERHHHHDRNLVMIPAPPPPPQAPLNNNLSHHSHSGYTHHSPPGGSYGRGVHNHNLQPVVVQPQNHNSPIPQPPPPPPPPPGHASSQPPSHHGGGHQSNYAAHSYEHERDRHREHRDRSSSSSRDKRHSHHHHHYHDEERNWKKRKGYNY